MTSREQCDVQEWKRMRFNLSLVKKKTPTTTTKALKKPWEDWEEGYNLHPLHPVLTENPLHTASPIPKKVNNIWMARRAKATT